MMMMMMSKEIRGRPPYAIAVWGKTQRALQNTKSRQTYVETCFYNSIARDSGEAEIDWRLLEM